MDIGEPRPGQASRLEMLKNHYAKFIPEDRPNMGQLISEMIKDLAQRSASGTLTPDEYTGGTFAISNMGMFEVSSFVAIIHPPQSAVLAVGTVSEKPIVENGEITVAQMMTATLSADHRIVDGAEGAQFLIKIKDFLENPTGLIL